MVQHFPIHWWRRIACRLGTGRRRTGCANDWRIRPHLEGMEDRCVPSTVTNPNDAGAGSLRQAVADAAAGDTIVFDPTLVGQTITLDQEILIDKSLTITGPGAYNLTVSGHWVTRAFEIAPGVAVSISGLTLTQGSNATEGGAIYVNQGTLTLQSMILTGNGVGSSSQPNGSGGGLYNAKGTVVITNSILTANGASGWYGGSAGAIANVGGTITLANSTVSNNTAGGNYSGSGGGISNSGNFTIVNSTIAGNEANGRYAPVGGGIVNAGTLTFLNSTIADNQANGYLRPGSGGGLYNSGSVQTKNSIFAGNTARGNPPLSISNVRGTVVSLGHNLFEDADGMTLTGDTTGDLVGRIPFIIVHTNLGSLQNNGGFTPTIALLPGSDAINAGDNTDAPPTDQRGYVRIADGTIDIGAFESQSPNQAVTVTTVAAAPPMPVAGQKVTLTATVSALVPGALFSSPTGSVRFSVDGGAPWTAPVLEGRATLTFSNGLPIGAHTIVASYDGDGNNTGSTSASLMLNVTAVPTATTLATTSPIPVAGQKVTVTATVSALVPGSVFSPPTGSVRFSMDGGGPWSAPMVGGLATLTFSAGLPAGVHTIIATYDGDGNNTGSSSSLMLDVPPVPTATTLSVAPATSIAGQKVTLTATVSALVPGSVFSPPAGSVGFRIDGGAPMTVPEIWGLATLTLPAGLPGGVHTIVASYGGDGNNAGSTSTPVTLKVPAAYIATGADAGGFPEVHVFNATTGALTLDLMAYDATFTGGVRVAVGDLEGDGIPDIVTAAGPGGGPHIKVFSGKDGSLLRSFFAYDASFFGGVNVAVGDVNGDGFADIITGADAGGGPHVKVFSGKDGTLLESFFAYSPTFFGGVRVAAGDVNGDGFADIITAAGAGGGPHVKVFSGKDGSLLRSFFAYDASFTGGVYVGAGDINGDGVADIITGAGAGAGPQVKVFSGKDDILLQSFFAYNSSFTGGVRVAAIKDMNGDGQDEIVTGPGPTGGPHVKVFDNGNVAALLDSVFAYDAAFVGGIFIGGH